MHGRNGWSSCGELHVYGFLCAFRCAVCFMRMFAGRCVCGRVGVLVWSGESVYMATIVHVNGTVMSMKFLAFVCSRTAW